MRCNKLLTFWFRTSFLPTKKQTILYIYVKYTCIWNVHRAHQNTIKRKLCPRLFDTLYSLNWSIMESYRFTKRLFYSFDHINVPRLYWTVIPQGEPKVPIYLSIDLSNSDGVAGDYQVVRIVVLFSSYILALISINSLTVQLDPMA